MIVIVLTATEKEYKMSVDSIFANVCYPVKLKLKISITFSVVKRCLIGTFKHFICHRLNTISGSVFVPYN